MSGESAPILKVDCKPCDGSGLIESRVCRICGGNGSYVTPKVHWRTTDTEGVTMNKLSQLREAAARRAKANAYLNREFAMPIPGERDLPNAKVIRTLMREMEAQDDTIIALLDALETADEKLDEIRNTVCGWEWISEREEITGAADEALAQIAALKGES